MRYKAGDKIVLKGKPHYDTIVYVKVGEKRYYIGWDVVVFDEMIDHQKTEELRLERALNRLKYQVGEKVILKDDLVVDETYEYQSFHRHMRNLQGKELLLLSARPGERGTNPFYRVSVDGEGWSINDSMIDYDKTLSLKQKSVTTLSNTITVEMIGNIIETHTITAEYYVFDDCSWLHLYNSDDKIVCSFRVEDVKRVYINQ